MLVGKLTMTCWSAEDPSLMYVFGQYQFDRHFWTVCMCTFTHKVLEYFMHGKVSPVQVSLMGKEESRMRYCTLICVVLKTESVWSWDFGVWNFAYHDQYNVHRWISVGIHACFWSQFFCFFFSFCFFLLSLSLSFFFLIQGVNACIYVCFWKSLYLLAILHVFCTKAPVHCSNIQVFSVPEFVF